MPTPWIISTKPRPATIFSSNREGTLPDIYWISADFIDGLR